MESSSPNPTPRHRYSHSQLCNLRPEPSASSQTARLQLGPLATNSPFPFPRFSPSPQPSSSTQRHRYSIDQLLALRTRANPHQRFLTSRRNKTRTPNRSLSQSPNPTPASSPPTRSPAQSTYYPDDPRHLRSCSISPPSEPSFASSPPSRKFDFSHRFSNRDIHSSLLNDASDFKPSSPPREDHWRRSASPFGSPKSSGPPPGFEAVAMGGKITTAGGGKRLQMLFKSRICKGPDLPRNFERRITYWRNKSDSKAMHKTSESIKHKPSEAAAEQDKHEPLSSSRFSESGLSSSKETNVDVVRVISANAKAKLPVMSYNISGALSFEDFSRRLAAEVPGSDVEKNKTRRGIDPNQALDEVNASVFSSGLIDTAEKPTPHTHNTQINDDKAVQELTKWFGNASYPQAPENNKEDATFLSVTDIERNLDRNTTTSGSQEDVEELDSNVLSFFDSIKNRAVNKPDENAAECDTGDAHGPLYKEEPSPAMEDYFRLQYDRNENGNKKISPNCRDDINSSEVEQFFDLFTTRAPVNHGPKNRAQNLATGRAVHSELSLPAPNSMTGVQQTSDISSSALEKWFTALSLQGDNQD